MQQSSFSGRKSVSRRTHGMIWSINAPVRSETKHGRHLTREWDFRIRRANRPMEKRIDKANKLPAVLPLPVMIWITGLILAGSEGELMPFLNIAGAVIFFGASVWLGKILPSLEPDTKACEMSKKRVRYPEPKPAPAQGRLSFRGHDHGCAQGTHHLGMFGGKNLFFKGV